MAAAMLRVQQADALIAAREKLVQSAVGMVQMAIEELDANEICEISADKRAKLACNLLLVLVGEEKSY